MKNIHILKFLLIIFYFYLSISACSKTETDVAIHRLNDINPSVRSDAKNTLCKIGAPAVEPLIASLRRTKQTKEFNDAVKDILGKIGAPAVEPLIANMKMRVISTENAVNILGKIGAPAVEPLIAIMEKKEIIDNNDNNYSLLCCAVIALGNIKDNRAVDPLIAALQDKTVRIQAATALGKIKDSRAVEPLIVALQDKENDKDKLSSFRQAAARALGEIKDSRAVGPLIDALKDDSRDPLEKYDSNYRYVGAQLPLIKIGAPAVEPLIAVLQNKSPFVRKAAVEALGKIKDPRAIEPLIAALKDNYKPVSETAEKALRKIGGQPAIDALEDHKWGYVPKNERRLDDREWGYVLEDERGALYYKRSSVKIDESKKTIYVCLKKVLNKKGRSNYTELKDGRIILLEVCYEYDCYNIDYGNWLFWHYYTTTIDKLGNYRDAYTVTYLNKYKPHIKPRSEEEKIAFKLIHDYNIDKQEVTDY